jgi:uncharacterized protein
MIRINNIKISIDDDISGVQDKAAYITRLNKADMKNFRILKESIDARKKNSIIMVYHIEFECDMEKKVVLNANTSDVVFVEPDNSENFIYGKKKLEYKPIIIGSGPAGLFAGLILAKNGYKPIIFERGSNVDERTNNVKKFWETGELNTECNIQFGEGGAGTFSDGKLTTRTKDRKCDLVIEEFIKAGAPAEIAYSFKPHIGTDILKKVVKNIRNRIIELGGEVRFNSKLTDIELKNGHIDKIKINNDYMVPCITVIFALGHSARDTYEMLFSRGVKFEQKPFAIGARIEHLQSMIDESQYGIYAKNPRLKGADYRLAYSSKGMGRSCYSFCMCPGGSVVAAASENQRLVINGMSEYKRDKINANSAIVVGVNASDFKSRHPLAGVEFQRHYENLAFICGRTSYMAPVQLVGDFLKDEASKHTKGVVPSCTTGYVFSELKNCLPDFVISTMKEGLMDFERKIKGFASYPAVLTGIETRTSSPVRMIRDEGFESTAIKGIYPAGEGAGYAGGIMSAAVDGIKVAQQIMLDYSPY